MAMQQKQGSGCIVSGAFLLLLLGLGLFLGSSLLFGYRKSHNAIAEARTYVGVMNRAQQAHLLKIGAFAAAMDGLETGINAETEHYWYQTRVLNAFAVQNSAVAKREGLRHTIGLVWRIEELNTLGTNYQLCYSTQFTEPALTPQPSPLFSVLNWFQSQQIAAVPDGVIPEFDAPESPLSPDVVLPCPAGYASLR